MKIHKNYREFHKRLRGFQDVPEWFQSAGCSWVSNKFQGRSSGYLKISKRLEKLRGVPEASQRVTKVC